MILVWLLICSLLGTAFKPSEADLWYEGEKEAQQKQNNNVIQPSNTPAASFPLDLTGVQQQMDNQTLAKYVHQKHPKSKLSCMSTLCIIFFTLYLSYLANVFI